MNYQGLKDKASYQRVSFKTVSKKQVTFHNIFIFIA